MVVDSEPPEGSEPPMLSAGWGAWFIVMFLAIGSAFLVWRAGGQVLLASGAASFKEAHGVVANSHTRARGGSDYVRAVVLIDYEVDGHTHQLEVSGRDGKSVFEPDPDVFVANHPVGEEVVVFYDPSSPGRASLTRDVSWTREAGLAGGALLVTVVFARWVWRRRRSSEEAPGPGPG